MKATVETENLSEQYRNAVNASNQGTSPHALCTEFPRPLTAYLAISLLFTGLSFACLLYNTHRGNLTLGRDALYPQWAGFDFYAYVNRFLHLHSAEFFTTTAFPNFPWYYPAPAILVYYPFYLFSPVHQDHTGYIAFEVVAIALASSLAVMWARQLHAEGLSARASYLFCFGAFIFSYPLYFALQRGNVEALTWTLAAAAIYFVPRRRYLLAAAIIGIATSIKLYPALLFILLANRKRWREILFGTLIAITVTASALFLIEPNLVDSAHRVFKGVSEFTRVYTEGYSAQQDHSAFHLVKFFTYNHEPRFRYEEHRYLLIATPLTLLGLIALRRRPTVNLCVFLICGMVCLPPVSFDYTLVYLCIPLAWLSVLAVRASFLRLSSPATTLAICILAAVISPDIFFDTRTLTGAPGAFKALGLIGLMLLSVLVPFELMNPQQPTSQAAL